MVRKSLIVILAILAPWVTWGDTGTLFLAGRVPVVANLVVEEVVINSAGQVSLDYFIEKNTDMDFKVKVDRSTPKQLIVTLQAP